MPHTLRPTTSTLKPTGRQGVDPLDRVSDLIDTETGTWDVELVRRNFLAPDAQAILNIPIRAGGGEDFLAWAFERSGEYTVKTAYRTLVTRDERRALEEGTIAETSSSEKQLWTALWKLKVIPKVRVFWWRVLRGILPDYATMKYRHIRTTSLCDLCKATDEDLMHALVHCSHARSFWSAAREVLDLKLPPLHPVTWSQDLVVDTRFSATDRCKIISIMHAIWSSRNRWTHDEDGYNPIQAIKRARDDLALLDIPRDRPNIAAAHGWRPPEPGWVKINTDGSIDDLMQVGGGGGVARSHLSVLGAWSKPLPGVTDPFIAEVLALREGVIFAQLRGFSHVVMEVDCLEVVNLWLSRDNTRSIVTPIFNEIRERAMDFASFSVQHISRDANGTADLCAKHATSLAVSECWMDVCPSFIVNSLRADCNRISSMQ